MAAVARRDEPEEEYVDEEEEFDEYEDEEEEFVEEIDADDLEEAADPGACAGRVVLCRAS